MRSVLIVDDEKHTRDGLAAVLGDSYDVFAASNADEAINMLDAEVFDAVITDLRMAGKSGLSVIDKAVTSPYEPVCIMLTAYGNVEMAVEAMKRGASDFLSKPVDVDKLENILQTALKNRDNKRLKSEEIKRKSLKDSAHIPAPISITNGTKIGSDNIIAISPAMREVIAKATQVAHSKATVMLTGETGTGKELIAHLIHNVSPRKDAPLVAVHCAAIPSNLLESELFGYEKGAFTGASQRRIGRFEAANQGTIFLDEIGEIDASTQVKLLRFLETKSFERLGGLQNIEVNVRIICATNRDLKKMAEEGSFREDLYYRLNVVEIKIPSLREHPEDIEPLVKSYIAAYAAENEVEPVEILPDAMAILRAYHWTGNIRELRNFCENIVVMSPKRKLCAKDLDAKYASRPPNSATKPNETPNTGAASEQKIGLSKKENEVELIKKALEAAHDNKTKAAELLGISRRTLHRKIAEWNLE